MKQRSFYSHYLYFLQPSYAESVYLYKIFDNGGIFDASAGPV